MRSEVRFYLSRSKIDMKSSMNMLHLNLSNPFQIEIETNDEIKIMLLCHLHVLSCSSVHPTHYQWVPNYDLNRNATTTSCVRIETTSQFLHCFYLINVQSFFFFLYCLNLHLVKNWQRKPILIDVKSQNCIGGVGISEEKSVPCQHYQSKRCAKIKRTPYF